jgi:hypothetical protein
MITVCGQHTRVVDIEGFTIDELAGNVASKDDTLSIALVNARRGTSEPWVSTTVLPLCFLILLCHYSIQINTFFSSQ